MVRRKHLLKKHRGLTAIYRPRFKSFKPKSFRGLSRRRFKYHVYKMRRPKTRV